MLQHRFFTNVSVPLMLAVVASIASATVHAQLITRCGESAGHEYYYSGGLVSTKDAGWAVGKISGGQMILMKAGEGYDVLYSDAMGRTASSKEDGANIITVHDVPGSTTLVINYPGISVETWVFRLDASGTGELTYSQARYNGARTSKHNLLRAACSKNSQPPKK